MFQNVRSKIRQYLMGNQWGRWLLVGRQAVYLDHFARMALAVERYRAARDPISLRYRLHRCAHRVEKGLAMPARRRGAGGDAMQELADLLRRWERLESRDHPTYTWGLDVGARYFELLEQDVCAATGSDAAGLKELQQDLQRAWAGIALRPVDARIATPERVPCPLTPADRHAFQRVLHARKSIRKWTSEPVPRTVIEAAIHDALRAPSACNRQPFHVVAVSDRALIVRLTQLLTGGKGFAEDAPLMLALTSDCGAYSGHEQRNLAYIDGGLAAMAFLLSLTTLGYACVSMNWSVEVARDLAARKLLGLRDTEVILFFVGVGKPDPAALVPASVRRPASEALKWIGPELSMEEAATAPVAVPQRAHATAPTQPREVASASRAGVG